MLFMCELNSLIVSQHFAKQPFLIAFCFCCCFTSHLFRMQVYHLFGWFWIMNFIIALGQCVLAGAFASYYWALDKKNVSESPSHG